MKICVPIKEKKQADVLRRLRDLKGRVDLAEVWLDSISDLSVEKLLKKSPVPVVCVVKTKKEGGNFTGTKEEMTNLLIAAARNGAKYIDIPYELPPLLNKKIVQESSKLQASSPQVIISYHHYKKTPSEKQLFSIVAEMKQRKADVIKIATMAKSIEDTFQLILLANQLKINKIKHIIIAMGELGSLSRILTPRLGGEMMFAPMSKAKASAPGQLTVRQLHSAWKNFK